MIWMNKSVIKIWLYRAYLRNGWGILKELHYPTINSYQQDVGVCVWEVFKNDFCSDILLNDWWPDW